MRLRIWMCVLVFVLLLSFSASNLEAKSSGMDIFVNAGVVTDDSLSFNPFIWTAGITMDFHLGDYLMLSPEGFVTIHKFDFDPFWLSPAVLLNVKFESFFVGAGVTKWFLIGDGYTVPTDLALKINAGITGQNFRGAAFAVMDFDNLFSDMIVGATFGFRF